jgi:hypothetical protein
MIRARKSWYTCFALEITHRFELAQWREKDATIACKHATLKSSFSFINSAVKTKNKQSR